MFSEITLPEQLTEDSQEKAKTLPLFTEVVTKDIYPIAVYAINTYHETTVLFGARNHSAKGAGLKPWEL